MKGEYGGDFADMAMDTSRELRHGFCQFINTRTNIVLSVELRERVEGNSSPADGPWFRVVNYIGDTEFSEEPCKTLAEAYRAFGRQVEEYAREKEGGHYVG